jgi:hypothetical protein
METKRLHRWPIFVLVLVVLGVLASADSHSLSADDGWRRTAQGWEHVSTWQFPRRTSSLVYRPPQVVHPLLLVAFQGTLSVLALACVNSQHLRKQKPTTSLTVGVCG